MASRWSVAVLGLALGAGAMAMFPVGSAAAQPGGELVPESSSVSLIPAPGTEFVIGDHRYAGVLEVSAHGDGLALVEEVGLDGYLAGIAEVPFSWPAATLQAQAVAARTYLAWTLAQGRSSTGTAYGFDICATDQCQVYAGSGLVDQSDGGRWVAAVAATTDQVPFHGREQDQALYSSSAGSRTRPVQDIFGGDPKAYLVGAPSPEAAVTPFARWEVSVDLSQFRRIMAAAGHPIGSRVDTMAVVTPPVGEGTATLVVEGLDRIEIPVADVRSGFNRYGPVFYPAALPARRPDGNRWPQTILSYTFEIGYTPAPILGLPLGIPPEDVLGVGRVTFIGEGWGHSVGMSQYGAYAMGLDGASAGEILAHYYNGLVPENGAGFIPERVRVGLDWGQDILRLVATGPFEASGLALRAGSWRLTDEGGLVRLRPAEFPEFDADRTWRIRFR
ncbi:MAG: SpoIID/LytB domain-containing protein [Acidimicrobiia bacterium]